VALRELLASDTPEQRREREERLRQQVANLKAETERQLAEALASIVAQLSRRTRALLSEVTRTLQLDSSQQLQWAIALLDTEGLDWKPRREVLLSRLGEDEQERNAALLRLASKYNRGQTKNERLWALAKEAWLEAHRRGRKHRAVADAMKAGGFEKTAVYERAKKENWRAALSR
jgi:16S rRNA C1402 (ribose-2'-O) methylase RsmI